jgi:hypothetical protein
MPPLRGKSTYPNCSVFPNHLSPAEHVNEINSIADGEWREDVRSKKWVGIAVAVVLRIDTDVTAGPVRVKALLKTWIESGALRIERRKDEESRKPFNFVLVGEWAET